MSVELKPAFSWQCPCGRLNFEDPSIGQIPDEMIDEIEGEGGVGWLAAPDAEPGDVTEAGEIIPESRFLMQMVAVAPKRVKCEGCGEWHETEMMGEDDDD